jgi:diguanylate cyclase (GGDEF)-like protein
MNPQAEAPADAAARLMEVQACLTALDMPRAFEIAIAAAEAAGTDAETIASRYWLARCHYTAGEIDAAITWAAEAGHVASHAGEPIWLARAQTLEARCLDQAGETHAALDLALMALHELERAGRTDEEALRAQQGAMTALGVVYLQLGDLSPAMDWCQRAADLAAAINDLPAVAAGIDTVACVHSALAVRAREAGRQAEAEDRERLAIDCSRQAVNLALQIGHVDYETSALLNLAESLTLVGQAPQALALLHDWAKRHPNALPRQWVHQLDSLGQVYMALGRVEEAAEAFEQALGRCESHAYRALLTEHLSAALERCGRWREALEQYKAFHALQAHISAERAQRSARVAAARVDIERERARARRLASSNQKLRRRTEDLIRQANEDPLTGLPNRRLVDSRLRNWPRPMALALIDVDHFKQVNDRFSHAVGDEVLKQLASMIRSGCRPQDVAARLGGEEFVLILEGAQGANAVIAAERLRLAVEAFPWESLAPGLSLTVSIGVAGANEATDGKDLLAVADRRLYAAKREGRNRVVQAG